MVPNRSKASHIFHNNLSDISFNNKLVEAVFPRCSVKKLLCKNVPVKELWSPFHDSLVLQPYFETTLSYMFSYKLKNLLEPEADPENLKREGTL